VDCPSTRFDSVSDELNSGWRSVPLGPQTRTYVASTCTELGSDDGAGLPLAAAVTAANVYDTTMLTALLEDVPPVRTPSGRRRIRPGTVQADKGYDSHANRAYLRRRGIRPRIARRGIDPRRTGLGAGPQPLSHKSHLLASDPQPDRTEQNCRHSDLPRPCWTVETRSWAVIS
jgi:hypothetical protein